MELGLFFFPLIYWSLELLTCYYVVIFGLLLRLHPVH